MRLSHHSHHQTYHSIHPVFAQLSATRRISNLRCIAVRAFPNPYDVLPTTKPLPLTVLDSLDLPRRSNDPRRIRHSVHLAVLKPQLSSAKLSQDIIWCVLICILV